MADEVVLVVDDDADTLELLRIVLEDTLRVRAVLARSGQEALEQVRQVRPALVITDLKMPPPDGVEVIRALKSSPDTAAIPVIVTSAMMKGEEAAVAAGCDDFLQKPFELEALLQMVRQHLG